MSDSALRCALLFRLESSRKAICLAKYDHAGQYETHGGADTGLYGGRDKSFAEAVSGVISNDPPTGLSSSGQIGGFKVVQSDVHQVVYGADMDGLCCAVITGNRYQSRVAIQMLQELYKEFSSKYGKDAKSAAENSLNRKTKSMLQDICKKYEDPSKVDKTAKVLGQVDAVKGQMQSNIANMLKNTEKAENMAAKSEQLNEQASVFKKRGKELKQQMAWKNMKMTLILGGLIAVILLAILLPVIRNAKAVAGKR